jgi:hypothetical protein
MSTNKVRIGIVGAGNITSEVSVQATKAFSLRSAQLLVSA